MRTSNPILYQLTLLHIDNRLKYIDKERVHFLLNKPSMDYGLASHIHLKLIANVAIPVSVKKHLKATENKNIFQIIKA